MNTGTKLHKHKLFNRPHWSWAELQISCSKSLEQGIALSKQEDLSYINEALGSLGVELSDVKPTLFRGVNSNYSSFKKLSGYETFYSIWFFLGDVVSVEFFSKNKLISKTFVDYSNGNYKRLSSGIVESYKAVEKEFDLIVIKKIKTSDYVSHLKEDLNKIKKTWNQEVDETKSMVSSLEVSLLGYVDLFPGHINLVYLYEQSTVEKSFKSSFENELSFHVFKDLGDVYQVQSLCERKMYSSWKMCFDDYKKHKENNIELIQKHVYKWNQNYLALPNSSPFKKGL